jgi:hypothetical protein
MRAQARRTSRGRIVAMTGAAAAVAVSLALLLGA